MVTGRWVTVRPSAPCPVCRKGGWCRVSADGGSIRCMRVESSRPSKSGGWIHKAGGECGPIIPRTPAPDRPRLTAAQCLAIHDRARRAAAVRPAYLTRLASELGLSVDSLDAVGIGWLEDREKWSFPMMSPTGEICGIRTRDPHTGEKRSVAGSSVGLFIPSGFVEGVPFVVVEGPSDCAAGVMVGLNVVGRADCQSKPEQVVALARRAQSPLVEVIPDRDPHGAGERGARVVERLLASAQIPAQLIRLPAETKDLRELVMLRGFDGVKPRVCMLKSFVTGGVGASGSNCAM